MAAKYTLLVVDAFAEKPYRGNPAGVVLDADGLNDRQMQAIAREVNASETAFVSGLAEPPQLPLLRWFTPSTEVGFCGHATLAAAHALRATGRIEIARGDGSEGLAFETTSAGTLRLVCERVRADADDYMWWLHMPRPALRPDHTNPVRTCELLGLSMDLLESKWPIMRTRDDDLILFMNGWQALMELTPRFDELGRWCQQKRIRGVCVSTTQTLSAVVNVHSRFFAPAAGVNEDPVTGSVHGPLALLLVQQGAVPTIEDKAGLCCAQGRPGDRTGLVRAIVEKTPTGHEVLIGGSCQTTIAGEVFAPAAS